MSAWDVVELRNYEVDPERREEFADHFERRLVHTQEAEGMAVLGQFAVVDRPDRFVWLRAFTDREARRRGLEAFYAGAAWKEHRDVANAIMRTFDHVHLLRVAPGSPALAHTLAPAAPRPLRAASDAHVVAAVSSPASASSADTLAGAVASAGGAGVVELARLAGDPAPNDFPALPVHQHRNTAAVLATTPTLAAATALASALSPHADEVLVLAPFPRSPLP